MAQRRYRLYLDYYNGGELWDPLCRYSKGETEIVPEAFIWYVLRVLSSACLILQFGTTADQSLPGWKPITHSDIVLTNIFTRTRKRDRDDGTYEISESAGLSSKRQKRLPSIDSDDDEDRGSTEWPKADWGVSCELHMNALTTDKI
jgi:hypothetical protein